ncbi:MAG: hypothetical protein CVV64_11535 [Candidatus Wallbacteria bacterium HGW-Wallbacteria-1]|jgi:hypothetical protein|uniref:Uncharacterized protein n=1 Tax=Candidatus Wallbacteria bacterium HGW-Wallbacteria-1 TaxID=2013854 RepID=A0A2N1PNP5_9BACT|nr:MAG: hypothetical protein CVV64_11535 [Candidatus Wallbacteria bacterium HGW-Wallbacteria-1]
MDLLLFVINCSPALLLIYSLPRLEVFLKIIMAARVYARVNRIKIQSICKKNDDTLRYQKICTEALHFK